MATPLYKKIILDLENKIQNEMSPNEKLPSERQLLDQYHVSRNTIRLALRDLEVRGIVYRLHGKGTFVSTISVNETNLGNMYSFSNQVAIQGHKPSTQNRTFDLINPTKEVSEQLHLADNERVYKLVRVRLIDDEPRLYSETFLPESLFPDLIMSDLNNKQLYDVLKSKYNQIGVMAFEDIQAVNLGKEESDILKVKAGSPALKIYRRVINDHNITIEFTRAVARGDKFIYRTRQYNNLV